MEDRNRSDVIFLPRWESFQIQSNEPGMDFPSGPFQRMIAKLYGVDGPLVQKKWQESMRIAVISSGSGQLMDKTRQEGRPSRFGPAVTQHTEGSRHDDEPVRSGPAVTQHTEGSRHDDEPVRSGPVVTQHTEGSRQDDEPVRSGPAEPKHLADKTRLDIGLVQSSAGDDHPADKVSATVVLSGGQSKDLADKVELDGAPAGVIFMCNNQTKQICFQYGLFGLPSMQLKLVQRIVPGTKLFLFVMESRELHGIFEASSNGGFNLEPTAFGKAFPSQVRFRICRHCRPLREKDFRKAIEDNYYEQRRFRYELSSQQVLNLLQLFSPEGFLDEKERKHETLMPNHTHAHGKKDFPVSDPADSQSELSMEISSQDPQNSPAVDSRRSPHSMLFMESRMGVQPYTMDASRGYRAPFKDVPAVSRQDPMGDRIHMRGLHSIPLEGSRDFYSPSVDGPMLSKPPYMDVMGGSQSSLTKETKLLQPSLGHFQRDSTAFLGEASGEIHHPMVDVRSRALGKTPIEGGYDIYADKRHYFSSSRVDNGSYGLDASDNDRKGSLYGSALQPYGSGAQSYLLGEQAEEKGNFHVKDNLHDSMHQSYAPNTNLQSWDVGVLGQRFSDADVERGKFLSHGYLEASDHHISGSQLWSRAEVTGSSLEQNRFLQSNPNESDYLRQEQAERLARLHHMYKQDQQRSQENIKFDEYRDLPGGWVDASSFHSHKRVSEDPVDDALKPVKRQHYYNESYGQMNEHTL